MITNALHPHPQYRNKTFSIPNPNPKPDSITLLTIDAVVVPITWLLPASILTLMSPVQDTFLLYNCVWSSPT